ncbi:MAG: alpha/beta hydrolase [Mucilaginibacter sp.]|uniref:alpha/beta hydrolase n=1 Tax=Mucilaginibacter sp. TaxID=1882438 RepID=UPI00326476C0
MKNLVITVLLSLTTLSLKAQTIISLYAEGKIPNSIATANTEVKTVGKTGSIAYTKVSIPTLEVRIPEKGNGTAVVICPGGGYSSLQYTHEGTAIADEFLKRGIATFVLKYRLPSDAWMKDKNIGPLQDAQQAIKIVRMRAKEWGVDTAKVGIIGFSAGGHLAATAGTHFDKPVIDNKENTNLRPTFMVLVYPVISLSDSLMHKGSRDNLLGKTPSAQLVDLYSADKQVAKNTPPAFLAHAGDDHTVKVANSVNMYTALQTKGISAELHVYPKGGHGFAGRDNNAGHWIDRCYEWMKENGWL